MDTGKNDRKPRLDAARFGLRRPRELLEKLHYDIRRLNLDKHSEKLVTYAALDCSIDAWSMVDWTFHVLPRDRLIEFRCTSAAERDALREFAAYLIGSERIRWLETCRQLATGSKHFYVDIKPDLSIHTGVSGIAEGPADAPPDKMSWTFHPRLFVSDVHYWADEFFPYVHADWVRFLDTERLDLPSRRSSAEQQPSS